MTSNLRSISAFTMDRYMIIIVILYMFVSFVSSRAATLQNPDFESPPTNLTTNVTTSQSVLLKTRTNVIPGWSFNGTVWYVASGRNVSLPKNGHGMQLGPNGMINQTFKSDKDFTYDYVLTFTLAPSGMSCANNFTAVNVSGPTGWQIFSYKESVGTEMWQTYAFSIGSEEIREGIMGIQVQNVVTGSHRSITCWPIVDTFIITSIENPIMYGDRGLINSGFEVGPTFLDNSSQGILLEGDSSTDPFKPPLQQWNVLGIVKYIDSKHFSVPRGRGAIELISGSPSGIVTNIHFSEHGQFTLDFFIGDANDSCVGDLTVSVQIKDMIWNFTTRSIGVGSSERHSVTFKAKFSNTESVPISFFTFSETQTSDKGVLCGPVIDSTRLQFSSSLHSEINMHTRFIIFSFVLTVLFVFVF